MYLEELKKRNLPPLLMNQRGEKVDSVEKWRERREEIKEILERECYGITPDVQPQVRAKILMENPEAVCGKAVYRRILLEVDYNLYDRLAPGIPDSYSMFTDGALLMRQKRCLTFQISLTIPRSCQKAPVFIWIANTPLYSYEWMPIEEIIDGGYAVASYFTEDIAYDRQNDVPQNLIFMETANHTDAWGGIGRWAWAASRVMDYLETVSELDADRVAVMGASRLGKTALWAGANDERFSLTVPVIDGTGGGALYRGNKKETLDHLISTFPHWFCGNYQKYSGRTEELPFDGHFLLAMCAPRNIYICLGEEDIYADYESEILAALAAGEVYRLYGMDGLVAEDKEITVPAKFPDGKIGMHIRRGTHYVSRHDWSDVMDYRDKHHV